MLEATRRLFGRLLDRLLAFLRGHDRVSGLDPRTDLPCEWCGMVVPTAVNAVWSKAFPAGSRYRMCRRCSAGCAGG